MKILVLGSGAREHALVWRLQQDPEVTSLIAAPGNPGMAASSPGFRTIPIELDRPDRMVELAGREHVDLTVVGPELPLAAGVADRFRAAGMPIVGPSAAAARLETSKSFAKAFMNRHGVPTAPFTVASSAEQALAIARTSPFGWPLVIKADGLAGGKGVVVAANQAESESAVREAMVDRRFGDAGGIVVFEQCLYGPEVSVFALSDGADVRLLISAQDHKRAYDGDRGPNTGGMGAFAPSPLFTRAVSERVMAEIIEPVIAGMRAEGQPYQGILYAGLMLTADGPKVIEFNVRFGDPEAQVVLPALAGPLAKILLASAQGRLRNAPQLEWNGEIFVGVVLASAGYPAAFETGKPISGLATKGEGLVFHGGTAKVNGGFYTSGGRVLTVVGRGQSYGAAIDRAYYAVSQIGFDRMHYRKDIGRSALQ